MARGNVHPEKGSGASDAEAHPVQRGAKALPVTSLDLVLTGVVIERKATFALIGVDGAPEAAHRTGDRLGPDVVLQAVYSDGVVIARGRELEWLGLRARAVAFGPASSRDDAAGTPDPTALSVPSNDAVAKGGSAPLRMSTSGLRGQVIIGERRDGGFPVKRVQPDSVFGRLGLRAGDALARVNGRKLESMAEVIQLHRALDGGATGVRVEVVRDGTLRALELSNEGRSAVPLTSAD